MIKKLIIFVMLIILALVVGCTKEEPKQDNKQKTKQITNQDQEKSKEQVPNIKLGEEVIYKNKEGKELFGLVFNKFKYEDFNDIGIDDKWYTVEYTYRNINSVEGVNITWEFFKAIDDKGNIYDCHNSDESEPILLKNAGERRTATLVIPVQGEVKGLTLKMSDRDKELYNFIIK